MREEGREEGREGGREGGREHSDIACIMSTSVPLWSLMARAASFTSLKLLNPNLHMTEDVYVPLIRTPPGHKVS